MKILSSTVRGPENDLPAHVYWVVELEYMGQTLKVTANHQKGRDWGKKSRVYGALDALVPELMALEPFRDYLIPATPVTPDDKVRAKMWDAWRKSTTAYAGELLVNVLETIADHMSINKFDIGKPRFSKTAGCECPCSPGFILAGAFDKSTLWIDRIEANS